ncbi:AAA-like domain-containing protein [Nostoc sp. FACHB-145]|nr:AAA-like domain-containing protein [Nostoc sp. FACHB-145]
MRPLKRKVPSTTKFILDEEATVNRIIERDIWQPVIKPEPERWLSLELIVEESRSSFIWQELIDNFQQILENQGAFRSIRVWTIKSENHQKQDSNLSLIRRRRRGKLEQRQHLHRELIYPDNRGLILLVSDCVSPLWQNATLHQWLKDWSESQPTAIVQLFPERLWDSTQLSLGRKLFARALKPGVANHKLILDDLPFWLPINKDDTLVLPVLNLEPQILKLWTHVVAGFGNARISTYLFDLEFIKLPKNQRQVRNDNKSSVETSPQSQTSGNQNKSPEKQSPEIEAEQVKRIVKRFLVTASPIAQRLAGMMAAAPVDISVVNLIRKTCLKEAQPVHVAEVYMGGLLRVTQEDTEGKARVYDFIPGVRKVLNQAMAINETENVLDAISKYIGEKIDRSVHSFTALIDLLPEYKENELNKVFPFARIGIDVLRNLGEDYVMLAEEILARCSGKTSSINISNEHEQQKPLNEAKVLVVGQGSVGKTSLIERLIHNKYYKNQPQTDGLNVETWNVQVNNKDIRLNVWDFGGQEIYHATHQFFLTKRSLYLLVCNCRTSEEENRIEYWLKLIESFGGKSPVIIVGNKKDEQPLDINSKALREKYPNIQAIIETSCQDNIGIDELRTAILQQIANLKEVYDLLPLSWFEVKQQLESMPQDFITYSNYIGICYKNNILEEQNQDQLIDLLHRLGLVLNFRDHPILKDTNVLKPNWVTEGIYALLSDETLKTKTKGVFTPADLSRILDPKRYPAKRHGYLIGLMKEFELCFELDCKPPQFLIAGLLPKDQPDETALQGETLEFQYHYNVLPSIVISRFIARMYHLADKQIWWRSGIVLKYGNNRALVKSDHEDQKILISISGSNSTRRELLAMIRYQFQAIHQTIKGLIVEAKISLPNHPEIFVDYTHLLNLQELGEITFIPPGLREKVSVQELLNSIEFQEGYLAKSDRTDIYIERPPIEQKCYNAIVQPGALIRIKAPQRMGKTLLLEKILNHARAQGYQTAKLDLKLADIDILANLKTFLQWLCIDVADSLELEPQLDKHWQEVFGLNKNCTRYFQKYLLSITDSPLVLAIDNFERLFDYPEIFPQFCLLLRGWYEAAKQGDKIGNIWKKLRLVVVHSTESYPSLDTNHSPFNVGLAIELPEFSLQQVVELANQSGLEMLGGPDLNQLIRMVGGHPYLVQQVIAHLKSQQTTLEELLRLAPTEQGIFSDHLRQQLWHLQHNPQLETGYKRVVMTNAPVRLDTEVAFKLHSLGLVKLSSNDCVPSCDLYRQYFSNRLG